MSTNSQAAAAREMDRYGDKVTQIQRETRPQQERQVPDNKEPRTGGTLDSARGRLGLLTRAGPAQWTREYQRHQIGLLVAQKQAREEIHVLMVRLLDPILKDGVKGKNKIVCKYLLYCDRDYRFVTLPKG